MKRIVYLLLISLVSCLSPEKPAKSDINILSYARGFEIIKHPGFEQLVILKPWQKSNGESYSYILTSNPEKLPDSLKLSTIIRIPVKRVIALSSTHIGFIASLGKSSEIVGISGRNFVNDSTVCSSLENKTCLDVGFAPDIDFESILLLKPDVVFIYGLDPSISSLVKRLEEAGIKSVLVSEFLEEHPLGKAEWIRFFAAFFGCETKGDSIFNLVEHNYLSLRDSASVLENKPEVLVGLPWKDTWFMAGGKSFTARFIEDAGGNYLWKNNGNSDFIPLDMESVFRKAINADVWINTGSAENLRSILAVDQRFTNLPVFNKAKLYNNNLRLNKSRGNDFWESGAVRPDLILSDLVKIFHGDNFSEKRFYYYRKLQ